MSEHRYCYEYPRPMVTVDAVVLAVREGRLHVLLVQRKADPYAGRWALPGGFVEMDEPLEDAVVRELQEETGLTGIRFEQLHTFGDPGRDPRGRSISTAYVALVDPSRYRPRAADDAGAVRWLAVDDAHGLAFDHDRIVRCAVERMALYARYRGIGAQVLRAWFTLDELRSLYETVEGSPIEEGAFAARMHAMGVVEPSDEPGHYRFTAGFPRPL